MRVPGWLMTFAVLMSLSIGRALAGEPATAVATITAGFVSGITVTSGGSGYTSEPAVTLSGGGGSGATAKAILSGDKVALILVLTAGSGYLSAPTVVVEAPPRAEVKPSGPTGFVWIALGTFVMGSPSSEPDRYSDEAQHTVTLTQGFWMSDHETTQAEYQLVMGSNPSYWKGENLPVEAVSWDDAVAYCRKLTERERAAGRITAQQAYRLPTESEWEYAARGGTTGARYGELETIAWHAGNSGSQTHFVKGKTANAWGLYDMMGNVWEWCSDWDGDYPSGSVTDPIGPGSGSFRVRRGGSWSRDAGFARSADRRRDVPGNRNYFLGFRPALSSVR